MRHLLLALVCAAAIGTSSATAQVMMAPLSSFGGGDGWFAPGEGGYTFLGTANNERGMAYGNGHLYLVSRAGGNNIRILDGATGVDLGGLNTTGITGGTFAINQAATGGDGVIYVGNLTTNNSTTAFKVYSWANEAAAPTTAVNSTSLLAGGRIGDSLAGIGSGNATRLAAGFGSTPAVTGNNGYGIVDPTTGIGTAVAFAGTPPNAGDFRLGITFTDDSHVIGAQGSSLYRHTGFSGTTGTLLGSPAIPDPAGAASDRLLAYAVVGGMPLLAVQNIGDSHVSLYDVSDPNSPVFLLSGNNTSGALTANANGSGELAWNVLGNSATLYAMSTNQGIQAFSITVVPEPSSMALTGLAVGGLAIRRLRRKTA